MMGDKEVQQAASTIPSAEISDPPISLLPLKITRLKVQNFKAIDEAIIPLSDFTVIVGTNGSGKSSILQALHWMFQSGRNSSVSPERIDKGSTLSEIEATYMPSPDYKNASHSSEYGNFSNAPKMDITIDAEIDGGASITVPMWIKSARNEGISVHIPSNNQLTTVVRSSSREISAYIPGLAGIPLSEEKRSKRIVHRQAAAGDANTVLRNILDLLRNIKSDSGSTLLQEVEGLVSKVLGPVSMNVWFDDDKNYKIHAEFQTLTMKTADPRRFKPLELAGIGFLQVIQIFAYLVYFKPRLLLVDEPDSHLHPDIQEKLTTTLIDAARQYNCQVILTTHSPSVVRALTNEASLVWMKEGKCVSNNIDQIRRDMGWGLLDKTILLVTEDEKVGMLNKLLSQWPDLQRKTAVWAARGSSSLPPADTMSGLRQLFSPKMRIVLHRDSDFMLPEDQEHLAKPYKDKALDIWFPDGCDIESYWANVEVIAAVFAIPENEARELLDAACENEKGARTRFNTKRNQISKIAAYERGLASPLGHDEAYGKFEARGRECTHVGKELLSAIRAEADRRKLHGGHGLGKIIPSGIELAPDLKRILSP